ncbi:MAG: phage host-nuclease inhibitor protein Gam [Chlamydiales bacterium]|jgi:phage host-nuclease inhibitor protein Gam
MTSRTMLAVLSATMFLFILLGCTPKQKGTNYARRAFLEQEAQKRHTPTIPRLDEPGIHDILVDVDAYRSEDWERHQYESVDQWSSRMQRLLEINRDALAFSNKELADLEKVEIETAAQVSDLVKRNDSLIRQISKPMDKESRERDDEGAIPTADFTIDLIRKGETLYSIAMKNYETAAMVKDIAIWNQGWIRHPDEVLAGLAVVLFPEEAREKQSAVVDEYLKKLRNMK